MAPHGEKIPERPYPVNRLTGIERPEYNRREYGTRFQTSKGKNMNKGEAVGAKHKKRCWGDGDELMTAYHDLEWGVPLHDDGKLFEFLVLEGMQAGLSWSTILRKRANFRKAFHGFDAERVARYGERDIARLLADAGIIRNRPEGPGRGRERAPIPRSPKGVRHLRSVHLGVRRGEAHPEQAPLAFGAPRPYAPVRSDQRRPQGPGVSVRRLDDRLCPHAGDRNGK